jgi:peptidoglycan/xylan/chitin deacetylase (PgdA/CDA1 family)
VVDRDPSVWQQSLSIAVVAAAIGFIAGCGLPVVRSVKQSIFIPITLPVRQQHREPNTSKEKALIAQQDEAYKKVIDRLVEQERVKRLNLPVPVQFQGKTIRDVQLNSQDKAIAQVAPQKAIALTFDDGPWPTSTSQVLDVLKNSNVKATFFMVGKQVQKYPQLVKQVVAEGHAIGNHTWSHQYYQYNESAAAGEIDRTAELVYKTTGVKTSLFRPPAGILNNGLVTYAHEKNYAVVMWSVDSKDWRSRRTTKQAFIDNVLKEAKPGGIVLLHDGGGDRSNTVQALPQLIAQLKKHGYKFVTVPELLEIADKKLKESKG